MTSSPIVARFSAGAEVAGVTIAKTKEHRDSGVNDIDRPAIMIVYV